MKTKDNEMIGKVAIPYIKHLSEKVARTFKKYRIQTIHRPTSTISNILCSSKKDKLHDLDKAGVLYQVDCAKHTTSYIGETERSLKLRAYDHRVISHLDSTICHSIAPKRITPPTSNDSNGATRKSSRNIKKIDYKALHTGGNQILNVGNTPVSEHLATETHDKSDVSIKIIGKEDNWWKRGVREAIRIKEANPQLNIDEGRYHISPIYSLINQPTTQNSTRPRRQMNPELLQQENPRTGHPTESSSTTELHL